MKYKALLIALLAIAFSTVSAQEARDGRIFVTGKAQDGRIYLRWAADDMFVLEQGLRHGFVVHRKTILIDNIVQEFPPTIELPGSPFKPQLMEKWEEFIDDDNFAIAAQALFGETFEITYSTNPFMQAAQREQERDQRLGFLLFACDQDFAVAQFAGLGLVDSNVRANETYLYVIFINDPYGMLNVDTGLYFIGPATEPTVPVMDDVLRATFFEHHVVLTWDIRVLRNFFSSYVIERSENGRNFTAVNDRPFLLLENPGTNPNEMVFIDSLRSPNITYHYRIRGRNAFGQLSEPSNVVRGRSQRTLTANPELLELTVDNRNRLQVSWTIDPAAERDVSHFEIRSRHDRFGEDEVLSANIASRRRSIAVAKPQRASYISVVAFGQDGSERPSFPMLFQEEDSIPPDPPVGLQATIDSFGVVHLQWRANTEDDLSGYRIFRANQATAEFIQITTEEIRDTVFFDTVSMNTTTSVFYRVMAIDFRGNQSQLSAIYEARRPILFAPTAPVITAHRLEENRLFLRWANSADPNVTATQILLQTTNNAATNAGVDANAGADVHVRANDANAGADSQSVPLHSWQILTTIPRTTNIDSITTVLQHSGTIKIATRSVSPAHTSELSNIIHLTPRTPHPATPELSATPNREQRTATLRWTTRTTEPIQRIQILRNEQGRPPTVLRTLSGSEQQYIDTDLQEGTTYEYRIRIETESQNTSFSRTVTVNF
ncbi:MAG: hypothetical protein FWD02_04195 [Bacteroidales bacterium]|nr:hypothetical protein [Bacteroidales bacterium]